MESEIWQFRTRAGSYGSSGFDNPKEGTPKDRLCNILNEMTTLVLETSGVKQTDFLRQHSMLDEAQLQAIMAALTQEVVLIQGPPGTGKR